MNKIKNESAYPQSGQILNNWTDRDIVENTGGLTKLEMFTMKAMQSLLTNGKIIMSPTMSTTREQLMSDVAEMSFVCANECLELISEETERKK